MPFQLATLEPLIAVGRIPNGDHKTEIDNLINELCRKKFSYHFNHYTIEPKELWSTIGNSIYLVAIINPILHPIRFLLSQIAKVL